MQSLDNNTKAFLELVRAGLWEKEAHLLPYGEVDYEEIMRLAEEQSVVGLVAAGLDHVIDVKLPKEFVLQFVGQAIHLEQQNAAMNSFIGEIVEKMREQGIYTILVKGQGIAQCYARPLWRSSGDVDLFLSDENYVKARLCLVPIASSVEIEGKYTKHLGMTIKSWVVELHGSLRCALSSRIDRALDLIKIDTFHGGNVRSWMNGKTQVFLLSVENDSIYVFTHFLNHFYKGGIGIRQICDWCRLLWTYRENIDHNLVSKRLEEMGLVSEWKAFGAFAVETLGMPAYAFPLYDSKSRWKRKAARINRFVIESGNFGHNRNSDYLGKYPFFVRKTISLYRRVGDLCRHASIFPLDSFRFFPKMMWHGLTSAMRGE